MHLPVHGYSYSRIGVLGVKEWQFELDSELKEEACSYSCTGHNILMLSIYKKLLSGLL